jgi:hypothetical protein
MNDRELDKMLKSAPLPEQHEEFWDKLPARVTTKIHWQSQQGIAPRVGQHRNDVLDWALGAGVVAVVCLVSVLLLPKRKSPTEAVAIALVEKCYRETEVLFPNQIQAIVFDEAGPRVVLAERADVPKSPPLYLKICGPHGCQEIVTFSGQQVRVNGDLCDVLTDAAGNVMLAGNHMFWSSQLVGTKAGRYRIKARTMEASS